MQKNIVESRGQNKLPNVMRNTVTTTKDSLIKKMLPSKSGAEIPNKKDKDSVADRLLKYAKNCDRKNFEKIEEEKLKDTKECTFRPKTNRNTRNEQTRSVQEFFDSQMNYVTKVERHNNEERKVIEYKKQENLQPKPDICEKSRKMFEKCAEQDQLDQEREVHKRLYSHSQERIQIQNMLSVTTEYDQAQIEAAPIHSFYRSITPREGLEKCSFAPNILHKSKKIVRNADVVTLLHNDNKRRVKSKERTDKQMLASLQEGFQQNHILDQSLEYLKKKFNELYEDAWKRSEPIEDSANLSISTKPVKGQSRKFIDCNWDDS